MGRVQGEGAACVSAVEVSEPQLRVRRLSGIVRRLERSITISDSDSPAAIEKAAAGSFTDNVKRSSGTPMNKNTFFFTLATFSPQGWSIHASGYERA